MSLEQSMVCSECRNVFSECACQPLSPVGETPQEDPRYSIALLPGLREALHIATLYEQGGQIGSKLWRGAKDIRDFIQERIAKIEGRHV